MALVNISGATKKALKVKASQRNAYVDVDAPTTVGQRFDTAMKGMDLMLGGPVGIAASGYKSASQIAKELFNSVLKGKPTTHMLTSEELGRVSVNEVHSYLEDTLTKVMDSPLSLEAPEDYKLFVKGLSRALEIVEDHMFGAGGRDFR